MWSDLDRKHFRIEWYSESVNRRWVSATVYTSSRLDIPSPLDDPKPLWDNPHGLVRDGFRYQDGFNTVYEVQGVKEGSIQVGQGVIKQDEYLGTVSRFVRGPCGMHAEIADSGATYPVKDLSPLTYYTIDADPE